jgi:hypothetical protein
MLKGLKYKISRDTLCKLYKSLIRPVMEYADVLWDGCTESESDLLEQNGLGNPFFLPRQYCGTI